MTVKDFFIKIKNNFLKFLFPKKITCDICKKEISYNSYICNECKDKLPFIKKSCKKCGCETTSDYCIRCKNSTLNFDKNIAVCEYNDFVKNIIYRYKCGDKYLYKFIAKLMTEKIQAEKIDFDIICFVPITKKVYKYREYNQSKLLAEYISKKFNIPLCYDLIKTKETLFQKNCPAKKRAENIKNAFKVINKENIQGKNVLLIDDVTTTGSTLSECTSVLKRNKAKSVTCCTFSAVTYKISFE